ncbi:signal transduction histidine kinase [Deinobacterium chartae]|uniref:histidine kinase n=1 Tax=Deinobacterium chartae TaxID=521158 RepID=A0A841I176_9DEIO|nr:hybrid sensor histidine kinase/response regulator [Deinobacterium chartae]MBB6097725.1 signal transduction histidine kinase [Deinobacterium chartae]
MDLRILHLEDNLLDAELVEAMLLDGGLGATVFRVDTEEDFRRSLHEFQPHIVLSDYSLPDFDGLSAFDYVREHYPHTPFLIVTGAMGEEVAIETLKRGVTDYVLKQRLERLNPAVQRALQEAESRRLRERAEAEIRALNLALQQRLEDLDRQNIELERTARIAEERKLALEETAKALEAALNLQRTFLAETSHELRTPLTALLGYLRRAEREAPDHLHGVLGDAIRVAEGMRRLVSDLLQLSRGELVQDYVPHFVNVAALVQAVSRDHGVAAEVPESLELVGDPTRLTQMLSNLVSNAVRICQDPALVRLRAYAAPEAGQVVLEVEDHGPGIPDELKSRIFDKFFRGKGGGSAGLGLTIAQQIVRSHNGEITVLDTPGGGATFRITLPALEEED